MGLWLQFPGPSTVPGIGRSSVHLVNCYTDRHLNAWPGPCSHSCVAELSTSLPASKVTPPMHLTAPPTSWETKLFTGPSFPFLLLSEPSLTLRCPRAPPLGSKQLALAAEEQAPLSRGWPPCPEYFRHEVWASCGTDLRPPGYLGVSEPLVSSWVRAPLPGGA